MAAQKNKIPKDYWTKRMESIEATNNKKARAFVSYTDKMFRKAQNNIDQKIEYWYQKIAMNEGVSFHAAKEMLREDELEDFKMSLAEYIKRGENLQYDPRWEKQMINASAKVHISRLEALKLQMQQECEVLWGNMTDGLDKTLTDIYTESYYHTAYELMRGSGVGWAFNKLDTRKVEQALRTAWAYDGKNFIARCWTNKDKLVNELQTVLTQSIIRGESPQKAISLLSKRMAVSRYAAGRLIMTESCAISTMAQKGCYKELGVERFEFVATLDSSTSEICRKMDGQVFDMSDYKIGINVPPLHCFCRSCTVPYYEDDFESIGERAARKEEDGKTYYVPLDMKYDEWKRKYVDKKLGANRNMNEPHDIRTRDEIQEAANRIELEIGGILKNPTTWDRQIRVVSANGVSASYDDGVVEICEDASDVSIYHELIHQHSYTKFGFDTYLENKPIEEATVEFLAQEMAMKQGLVNHIKRSDVDVLREVNRCAKIYETDYEFAIDLVNTDLIEREDYLVSLLYGSKLDLEEKIRLMSLLGDMGIVVDK